VTRIVTPQYRYKRPPPRAVQLALAAMLAGALALTAPSSGAQTSPHDERQPTIIITGNDLLHFCDKDRSFCFGYVIGILDDGTMHVRDRVTCLPRDAQPEQLLEIVLNYVRTILQISIALDLFLC
jgi:hypothetical protein